MASPLITVEFFGIPRQRAGRTELKVQAATLAELLDQVEKACPKLAPLRENGRVSRHYLLSLNGRHFTSDTSRPLAAGDRIVMVSADAGG
jgi:molybdopterin converting factor small subunit